MDKNQMKSDGGLFKYYFLKKVIQTKEDERSFNCYYSDRIGCLVVASLLELDMEFNSNSVVITSKAGDQTVLTFNTENFQDVDVMKKQIFSDMDSTIETKRFLTNEIRSRFVDAWKVREFSEAQNFLFNYIASLNKELSWEEKNELYQMLEAGRNNLYKGRLKTHNLDQDIIISGAGTIMGWINGRLTNQSKILRKITYVETDKEYKKALVLDLQKPQVDRIKERNWIMKYYSKETPQSNFWSIQPAVLAPQTDGE